MARRLSQLYRIRYFKKGIRFSECSWNHEYLGSLAKLVKPEAFLLTLQQTRIRSVHDSMNRPNIKFIAYIYIKNVEIIYNFGNKTGLLLIYNRINGFDGV